MSSDEAGSTGITQPELLMEMREDIKGHKATVDAIVRDQVLGVELGAAVPGDIGGKCVRLVGARGIARHQRPSDHDAPRRVARAARLASERMTHLPSQAS